MYCPLGVLATMVVTSKHTGDQHTEKSSRKCGSVSPGTEPLVPAQDMSSQVKREEALCVRGQRGLEERAIPTESITGE